jgi:hypothetical protein
MKFWNRKAAKFELPPPQTRWLKPSENPWGVVVLDCRAVTQRTSSVTSAPEVAQRYMALRAATGEEHCGALPENSARIACALSYPAPASPLSDGPLFKSAAMEEKWDVYLHQHRVYVARSWSGMLAYVADIVIGADRLVIDALTYSSSLDTEPVHAVRTLDFLIRSHVFHTIVPHPLPHGPELNPQRLAALSFTLFGRRCWFGTFDDTIPLDEYPCVPDR